MHLRSLTVLAALAASLGCAGRTPAPAAPAAAPSSAAGAPAATPSASDPAAVLPGVDLSALTPEQARAVAEVALREFCYCGCPHTLSQCLRSHESCTHAPRMAALAVRWAKAGATAADLSKLLAGYYAAFDRRAKLDVSAFGPPLGSADAPVTLVEFSDFGCPYCRQLRPSLEAFVQARAGEVKLFYKPFPIESHPGAWDAAQAAEWARDHDLFWPMHDRLMEGALGFASDDLAEDAIALGGDPTDLRDAIASGRYRAKIQGAQAEGRAAGMRGTPTIFMNGRLLSDLSDEGLAHALADEKEWIEHRGWIRD
jgi:protein-disulfide isomerase